MDEVKSLSSFAPIDEVMTSFVRAEVPGTGKTADELRREGTYDDENLIFEINEKIEKINEGIKHDQGKNMLGLLPSYPVCAIGRVFTFGANKYSSNNWRKGISWIRVFSALLRHLFAWAAGEDLDPESGEPHLAHAGCCLFFLLEYSQTHKELDDRWRG